MDYQGIRMESITVHNVGNKLNEERLHLSNKLLQINENISELLLSYFINSFKTNETYHLYHESDINLNEVFSFVTEIFNQPETLNEQSIKLAKHLYEQSTHPKIKGGEFYVVYFSNCNVDGKRINAIGLFKSESKDTFLKVYPKNDGFQIESDAGININKLDKGCMIFNTEKDNGYIVTVVDNTNKSIEAQYWVDSFLHIQQREDDYFQTKNIMSLCKDFVSKQLPQEFEVNKAIQADILNKSVKFFKEKENFDFDDFSYQVIKDKDVIESFKNYKSKFEDERNININTQFDISQSAVKKQSRILKSVIKLDKNFHIYIHGNKELIEKGFDENNGMNYYKVYFKEEN